MDIPGLNPSVNKIIGWVSVQEAQLVLGFSLQHSNLALTLFLISIIAPGVCLKSECRSCATFPQNKHSWKCHVHNSLQCSLSPALPASSRKQYFKFSPTILLCSSSWFPGEFGGETFQIPVWQRRLKPCSRWREPSQSQLCSALLWLIYLLLLGLSLITFLLLSHFHPFQLFLLFQPFLTAALPHLMDWLLTELILTWHGPFPRK